MVDDSEVAVDITKEEWEDWRNHPVTGKVLEIIGGRQIQVAKDLASGVCRGDNCESQYNYLVGYVAGLSEIYNISYHIEEEE